MFEHEFKSLHIYEEKWLSALRHIKRATVAVSRCPGSRATTIQMELYRPHIDRALSHICCHETRISFGQKIITANGNDDDDDDANATIAGYIHDDDNNNREQTTIAQFSLFRLLWTGNNSQLDELWNTQMFRVCAQCVRAHTAHIRHHASCPCPYTYSEQSRLRYARPTHSSSQFT